MQRFMLPPDGTWVGPPILRLRLRLVPESVIDGRKRLNEYKIRGLRTHIPELIVRSHLDAIKHLILNGHSDRAALHALTYAPEFAQKSSSSLSILLDVSRNKLQPYIRALKSPQERHKLPRRAMGVVVRARVLYKRVSEGDSDITINDLTDVLGDFLE